MISMIIYCVFCSEVLMFLNFLEISISKLKANDMLRDFFKIVWNPGLRAPDQLCQLCNLYNKQLIRPSSFVQFVQQTLTQYYAYCTNCCKVVARLLQKCYRIIRWKKFCVGAMVSENLVWVAQMGNLSGKFCLLL